jgi:two-component system sensor histidine kinase TctE
MINALMDANSLRSRLTRRLAMTLAFIGVFGTLGAYILGAKYANLAYDQALFDDVVTLAGQVGVDEKGHPQLVLPTAALKWLLADEGELVRYRVTDLRTHTTVASNGDLGKIPADIQKSGQAAYRDVVSGGRELRVAYTFHVADPDDVPVLVEIGETIGKRERLKRTILAATVLFMLTMVLVAVALVWQGVSTALKPLKLLEDEAAQRSGADLMPLDPLHAPEEVRGLIVAINRLMARVSGVLESQSHFIANAAHQLRTPLAGLRLQAQLARKAATPAALDTSLEQVEASADRAAHLVDQILVLSRAEAVDSPSEKTAIELSKVAHQVIERYLPRADQRSIDLGYEGSESSPRVIGNEVLFGELLGNLVDNAVRYGRDHGRVTVEVGVDGGEAVIAVSDDGPGFADADRERVFERFYRPDSSRAGGAGLGLAIVREIAERYYGRLSLESSPGRGSRFELRFPLLTA